MLLNTEILTRRDMLPRYTGQFGWVAHLAMVHCANSAVRLSPDTSAIASYRRGPLRPTMPWAIPSRVAASLATLCDSPRTTLTDSIVTCLRHIERVSRLFAFLASASEFLAW